MSHARSTKENEAILRTLFPTAAVIDPSAAEAIIFDRSVEPATGVILMRASDESKFILRHEYILLSFGRCDAWLRISATMEQAQAKLIHVAQSEPGRRALVNFARTKVGRLREANYRRLDLSMS